MRILVTLLKALGAIVALIIFGGLLIGYTLTWTTQSSDMQKVFLRGTVPSELPHGIYRGTVSGFAGGWKGKQFDHTKMTGTNIFESGGTLERKYPFRISRARGIRDTKLDVITIDYNVPGNPGWLTMVTDEIVETGSGQLLGKAHFRLIPGYPFALGFFELRRE